MPQTITNGVLSLQTEQEGGGEVVDVVHTGGVVPRHLELPLRQVIRLQVTVDPEHDVPHQGEHEPGHDEAGEENHEQVSPAQVNKCGPTILT